MDLKKITQEDIEDLHVDCDCQICNSYCKRPCWGTPKEIMRLIEAGYASRMYLDYWTRDDDEGGNIMIVCPAEVGYEGMDAPFMVGGRGCTFWDNCKTCALHTLGLKPIEGRVAYHDEVHDINVHEWVAMQWDTDEGRSVVELWKTESGYED
jgi:hypothetical protein